MDKYEITMFILLTIALMLIMVSTFIVHPGIMSAICLICTTVMFILSWTKVVRKLKKNK